VSRDIERAERLAAEIDQLLAELVQIVRDVKNAPTGGRRHWVFTHACGCAFGVQDAADETRPAAWRTFYEGRSEEAFAAMDAGAKLLQVAHEDYKILYLPHLSSTWRCPHQGGSG
jgi:hypothetical protein